MTQVYFYRNYQGIEVDYMLTRGHRIIGIECKYSSHITARDCKNLKYVANEIQNFMGIVLYRGNVVVAIDENILAVPFNIWLA